MTTRRAEEFRKFDEVMDCLLAVPKQELQQQLDREHGLKGAPKGRRPKPSRVGPGAASQAGK